ncbi:MAG: CCA tRNA nucleotidyltransferase [Planctomycetota bacterium]|nr:CCA tRNA nucleotidyltransferase [Planctomycetota bacterium]
MAAVSPTARDAAVQIVRTLRDAGHVAYFAGGCVRDRLLGREPKDHDVATDAKPEQVRARFPKSRFVGEAFGVVLVRLLHHDVEVATFRSDGGYEDGRRPTAVHFTDARHDALRRDFTINGLFEDPLAPPDEAIIDHVGGRADLRDRVIRAIGDPDARLSEDYLRMLRAVRFAARLGFALEEATAAAIRRHAADLGRISRERIGQEVSMMLRLDSRAAAAKLIQSLGLDAATFQEPHADIPLPTLAAFDPADLRDESTTEPSATSMSGTDSAASADLLPAALAAWLIDRNFPASAISAATDPTPAVNRWRAALCLSNDDRSALLAILTLLPLFAKWPGQRVSARKRLLARAHRPAAVAVFRALASHRPDARAALSALDADAPALFAQGVAPEPYLTGEDLIAAGRRPGPAFKRLLDDAYDLQLELAFPDRAAALAWLATQP